MVILDAREVANYFLKKQEEKNSGERITNQKVQKLCYYAQGFALAKLGRPLFFDHIEKWQHGPAVKSLYSEYSKYGYSPLPIPKEELDLNRFSTDVCHVLDTVNAVYGVFSATQLRNMTHRESPWLQTIDGAAITYQKMKAYFEPLVQGAPSESTDELQGKVLIDAMVSCPELAEKDKIARSSVMSGGYKPVAEVRRLFGDV